MTHHEQLKKQNAQTDVFVEDVIKTIIVVIFCFFLCFVQGVAAQEKLLPNRPMKHVIEPGKTDTYAVSLNDGDYVSGSINQHSKVNLSILSTDGSLLRRFPGPSEDAKRQFAFAAEGGGSYSIVIANPGDQPVKYELFIEKILSLNDRLRPEPSSDADPSPRIQALRSEIAAGNSTEAFWKEMAARGTPLVEPFGSDGRYQLVTFLWRATHETRNVLVPGSFLGPVSPHDLAMQRLGTSDVWYLTLKMPAGARFTYSLSPNDPMTWEYPRAAERGVTRQVDPLNPQRMSWGSGSCPANASKFACISVAELPHATPQPWTISKPETPRGKVEKGSLKSTIQGIERTFSVYVPANYKAYGPANALLVLFDAEAYLPNDPKDWYDPRSFQMLTTLNELIAASKIPPTVAVFIDNIGDRRVLDQLANPGFADFVATELVPWVRVHYNVTTDPKRTVVGGYSSSGFTAAYMGLRHSEVFGNVISQSGAFWWAPDHNEGFCGPLCRDLGYVPDRKTDATTEVNWMAKQFLAQPKLPVRFDLEAGLFEVDRYGKGGNILEPTRALRDVLLAKGYEVHYQQFVGGHDGLSWRGTIADALIALLGPR
jgi:enterochelin esterase-like enzyme